MINRPSSVRLCLNKLRAVGYGIVIKALEYG